MFNDAYFNHLKLWLAYLASEGASETVDPWTEMSLAALVGCICGVERNPARPREPAATKERIKVNDFQIQENFERVFFSVHVSKIIG